MPLKSVPLSLLLPLIPSIFKNRYTFGTQKTKIQGILPGDSNSCKTRLFTFELLFRNLNRRDSPLGSSLVSVEFTADETSRTAGRQRFIRSRLVNPASAVTSAEALTACAWEPLPKSEIWTAPQRSGTKLKLRASARFC